MTLPFDTIVQNGFLGYPPELEQMRDTFAGRMKGTAALYERQGMRVPTANDAANDPNWGLDARSRVFDESDQFSNPSAASEAIQQFDIQRCVQVDNADLTPTGVLYELLHWVVPEGYVAVVERLPTILAEVTSLAVGGVPVFTHGNLNGERPCVDQVTHVDPLVAPLTWQYAFTWSDRASLQPVTVASNLSFVGPASPNSLIGEHVVPPWNDLRFGHNANQGSIEQFVFPPGSLIRYWVTAFGPTGRFDVRIGARLVGFLQSCGRKGAALDSVLRRHV